MKENLKLAFKFNFKSHHSIFFSKVKCLLHEKLNVIFCLSRMFNVFFLISINNLQMALFNFFLFKVTNPMKYKTKNIP